MSSSSAVTQQRKVALIIGNQNYQKLPSLEVTLNDAKAVDELFQNLGFETRLFLDQTKRQMKNEIDEFGDGVIQKNDLVFFCYSGHGGQQSIQHDVHNMLCGIDATTDHDGVSLTTILRRYFQKEAVYFIIVDACRTFPKAGGITKGTAGSSTMQETPQLTLAMTEIPTGKEVEILFACQPNESAFEEEEKNLGHLVRALQDALKKVDRWDDVNKYIIKQVKEEMKYKHTRHYRQTPVVQSSITQPLYIRQVSARPSQSDRTEPSNLNIPSSSAAIAPLAPTQIDMTLQDAIQIFETQGKLENARIKLTQGQFTESIFAQDISFKYHGKSLSFKNVTFEYPKKTELPAFILLDVARGQQMEVENCSFHGVGLRVFGSDSYASITNSTFTDIKDAGMRFFNTRSVQVSEVGFKNCEDTAVWCYQVKEFIGKQIDIQNSDTGFLFSYCREEQLQLHDVNIQNCKNPIKLLKSANVKQHNVNIIS